MSIERKLHVCVTGASGFIGRHLCPVLGARGFKVTALVRSDSHPLPGPQFETFRLGEIGPETDWSWVLENADVLVQLAGVAHRRGLLSAQTRAEMYRVHSQAMENLARAARQANRLRRIVLLSSASVLGSASNEPFTESSECRPSTDYGKSKLEGERLLIEGLSRAKVDWCILRPPLVYGPGNPGNMARLVDFIKLGLPLPFASIKNQRSFIFVYNLADFLTRCLDHPGASRQVFLLSDGEDMSTPELVKAIGETIGKSVRLFACPGGLVLVGARSLSAVGKVLGRSIGFDSEDVRKLWDSFAIDPVKAKAALNWNPPYSLRCGLEATLSDEVKLAEPLVETRQRE